MIRKFAFLSLLSLAPTLLAEGLLDKGYDVEHPYYFKYCATTRFHPIAGKKGTYAGHAVFFLKGVCTDKSRGPAGLRLCDEDADYTNPDLGVGMSTDQGLQNVNFFTFPSRSLFFQPEPMVGQRFTAEMRDQIIQQTMNDKVFDGLRMHSFVPVPENSTPNEYLAGAHFGTDYAISAARNVYCMNVPMPRPVMGEVVDHLNKLNDGYQDSLWEKYRGILWSGRKKDDAYHWNVLWDNCTHTPINALAVVGVLEKKKINRPLVKQFRHIAVPSNTILDIHKAVHQEEIDVDDYYEDPIRREMFLKYNWIPQAEGASAEFIPMQKNNTVYKEDDNLLYLPQLLVNVSKKLRRLARTERYAYLGQGDLGFAPNLRYYLLKYEKALAKIEKKEREAAFKKDRLQFVQQFKEYLEGKKAAVQMRLQKLTSENNEH